ncbi:MAG: hypothetical protein HQM09_24880 [Candidatus Riflebacteria bacterium]|nr:hypothetical protein [Candidatus Riflebacteria bacterium]
MKPHSKPLWELLSEKVCFTFGFFVIDSGDFVIDSGKCVIGIIAAMGAEKKAIFEVFRCSQSFSPLIPMVLPYIVFAESRASFRSAILALYAVSVRRLKALRSGFLQKESRDSALAFG